LHGNTSPTPPPLKECIAELSRFVTQPWANFFNFFWNYAKPRWVDINIGSVALTLAASNQPALIKIASTDILSYGLQGTSGIDELHGGFEIIHEYQEGTDIYPHIHWYPSTTGAGNVIFNLDYAIMQTGGNIYGTGSVTTAAPGVAWQPMFSEFPVIVGTTIKIGAQMHIRLWRNASATGDTYAGVAVLGTVGDHVLSDYPGSLQKTSK